MKTLKNVETMYKEYEDGSLVVLSNDIDLDSLKSLILDAMEDVVKSVTPASNSKMVVDSEKYGHGVAEESKDGSSRQLVPPESQGGKSDPNARAEVEGVWDKQRQKLAERKERGEDKWKTKKSTSAESVAGIVETVLSLKSVLKSFNPSDSKSDDLDLQADKEEELNKLSEQLNKEEDTKTEKSTTSPELDAYDKKMEAEKRAISDKATAEGREMTKQERDKYQKAHMD